MGQKPTSSVRAMQGAIIVLSTVLALLMPRYVNIVAVAENWASDVRFALFNPIAEPHDEVVILAITEDTLSQLPYRSPVDREMLAGVLERLKDYGVKAVGLDILFDQPTEADKDAHLKRVLEEYPVPVVTGWTDQKTGLSEAQFAFQSSYLENVSAGYSNLFKDPVDGTVRNAFVGREEGGYYRESFATLIAQRLGHDVPREGFRIRYLSPPDENTPVFAQYPIHALAFLPPAWFKDKVVMIGGDLPFGDRHRTPFAATEGVALGTTPGVIIQAHILAQLLDGEWREIETLPFEIAIAAVLGLVAVVIGLSSAPMVIRIAISLGIVAVSWVGAVLAFMHFAAMLPIISPTLSFGIALTMAISYAVRLQKQQTDYIHDAFSHYLSPDMVRELVEHPDALRLGGEKKEMTLLFSDIRGFTTLSERLTPEELVSLLNRILTPLTGAILDHKGTVDKYMGDAIMAFWNAPLNDPDHALNACLASLELKRLLNQLNDELEREAQQAGREFIKVRMGVGVNTGDCIAGNIGSKQRFDYSALGDTVNTASRLEGQSKTYGVDIVIGEDTAAKSPSLAVLDIDIIRVVGKNKGVRIFALLGDVSVADTNEFQALAAAHAAMIDAYRGQRFADAADHLQNLETLGASFELDKLYALYRKRIDELTANPPAADWDGVYVAQSK
ncbi:adenylate/guanylate cyclase domain-containing protein [Magnetovibrio sp.]|uniref:adenylate/guanylate cyclase domain-containing protein n=1 Tax=Magnetovibrio sp. TaxID=2024836 RepID=UPI002F95C8A0